MAPFSGPFASPYWRDSGATATTLTTPASTASAAFPTTTIIPPPPLSTQSSRSLLSPPLSSSHLTTITFSSASPLPSPIAGRRRHLLSSSGPASPITTTITTTRHHYSYLTSRIRMMAVGLAAAGGSAGAGSLGRHAAEEEARAEVDVLNSRLEKTAQLTKKIEACLNRLEATGKSVREVAGPLNGETKRLQTLGHNIDNVIASIERLRQPADSKNEEEQIIRAGPEKAGLTAYLSSVQRLDRSLGDMRASNIRSTQQTMGDLHRLIKSGNQQLENYFDKLLRAETPREIEPLYFITKNKPFPVLSQDMTARLGLINAHVAAAHRNGLTGGGGGGGGATASGAASMASTSMLSVASTGESPVAKIYADVRGPYLAATLKTLAVASGNTAKRKTADTAVYRAGTNGIGTYAQAIEGLFLAEYDNICSIFTREDWSPVFLATCQNPTLSEFARTLRELNSHVKAHIQTDCYLAYEIVEIVSSLSNNLEARTGGELKSALAAALKPVRDTAKASLGELLDDSRRKASSMSMLPPDGAPLPVVAETMVRLQTMVEFLRPISSIMISLGDGGWRYGSNPRGGSTAAGGGGGPGGGSGAGSSMLNASDTKPSLSSFDVGADGRQIFAHYCTDTMDELMKTLDLRARAMQGRKPVVGVFLANSICIMEQRIRDSDLASVLEGRQAAVLDPWRKKASSLYTETCKDVSMHLFDVIHTNRGGGGGSAGQRTSNQGGGSTDSASIVKGLSSKDKENIKGKFTAFNGSFDEMVQRHKQYSMEREVRQGFARDIQQMLEPLYVRFWDRYHEIDKGKGKYVKYDKAAMSAVFMSLY